MEYIKEIVFAAVVCGLLVKAAPNGKTGGKFVKYAASLAFLCILVSPLAGDLQAVPNIIGDLADIGNTDDASTDSDGFTGSYEVVSQAICKAAADAAADHFSVSADDFTIRIIIDKSDDGEYSIREATVYPDGKAADIDAGDLEGYFSKILNCETEVILDE